MGAAPFAPPRIVKRTRHHAANNELNGFTIPSSSTSDGTLPDHAPFSAMAADAPRSAALAAITADQPRPQLTNVFVGLLKEKPILDGDGMCSPAAVRSVRPLTVAELWKCSHAPHHVRVPTLPARSFVHKMR
jgi:hypothetical protein